jgi:hypothetical protein
MAKVGSSSVFKSLKKGSAIPVFHIHSLDEEEVLKGERLCFERGTYPGRRSPAFLIKKKIIAKQRPYKVISLFRNPIDRNISAFFDAFELYMGIAAENYNGNLSLLEKNLHKKINQSYSLDLYEKQFMNGTEINVYNTAFDKVQGYTKQRYGGIDLLLMNSDLGDRLKEVQIAEFCEIPNFKLMNTNITIQGSAAGLYTAFREYIRFSETYLSSQLNSKYFDHFFSDEDKERLFRKWSK